MKYLLFSLLSLTLASQQAQADVAQCRSASAAEVRELFGQWNSSLRSGDAAQVASLYSADAVLLPTVSATLRLTHAARLDYFENFLTNRPSGSLDTLEVRSGCNEATAAGLYTFDYAASGKQVAARYTFTYRWNGQRWLISQHHSSLLPQS